jgi:hypothetical protein
MAAKYITTILGFPKFVTAARKKSCFERGQIGNTDEVLIFNVPLNGTVDTKCAKFIINKTYGLEKMHYSAISELHADGTKLPLLLIFKQK